MHAKYLQNDVANQISPVRVENNHLRGIVYLRLQLNLKEARVAKKSSLEDTAKLVVLLI